MYAPLEPLNAGVCGEPAPPLSNWYSVVFPFPSVAPSVHGAVAVVADPSRHANDTASLLIGGVTAALDWLQVPELPDAEPEALKVAVPPFVKLPVYSAISEIPKLVQLLAPVKVAEKVTFELFSAITPKIAPHLFRPVDAGATICLIEPSPVPPTV